MRTNLDIYGFITITLKKKKKKFTMNRIRFVIVSVFLTSSLDFEF